MKKTLRNLLCCGALFVSLTLTSCGPNPNAVKSVKIMGGETTVHGYSLYDYSNLELEVKTNNGKVSKVKVTDDMITQRIDTSSIGKQTLVITYNGKKYNLKVNIVHSEESAAAEEWNTKVKDLIASIGDDAKNAQAVTLKVKVNAGSTYFGNSMGGSGETGEPIFEMPITFTSEQINNGEMLKALALLQLGFDKKDMIAEGGENGPVVYANVDVGTFVNGLIGIGLDNVDYFRGLLEDGSLNVGGWQDIVAGYLDMLRDTTGIDFDAMTLELAIYDAFASMLQGNPNVGGHLIADVFTGTAIASIANFVGASIEADAGVEAGSTEISTFVTNIISRLVEIIAIPNDEEVVEELKQSIADDIKGLLSEVCIAYGAEPRLVTNAINNLLLPYSENEMNWYFSAAVELLDGLDKIDGFDVFSNKDYFLEALYNFAGELDNAINGRDSYILNGFVRLYEADYLDCLAYAGLVYTPEEIELLPKIQVLASACAVAHKIDKVFNGEEVEAQDIVDAFNDLDQKIEAFEYDLADGFIGIYYTFKTYFFPQITNENVNSVIETLEAMREMSDYQRLETLKQGFINFAKTEDTRAFVNDMTWNFVFSILDNDLYYNWDSELGEEVPNNPYAIYTEDGYLQPYITEIAERIVACIYGEEDFINTISNIHDIMVENGFDESFDLIPTVIGLIDVFMKGLTQAELTELEQEQFAFIIQNMLDIEFVDGMEEEGRADILAYTDAIRNIWLNVEETSDAKLQMMADLFNQTEGLFGSENLIVDTGLEIIVSFMSSIFNDMIEDGTENLQIVTRFTESVIRHGDKTFRTEEDRIEFNQDMDVVLKIAFIIDNLDNMTREEMASNIVQLVSLPSYVKIMKSIFEVPSYIPFMSKILVFAAFDVPGMDYNVLMGDFNALLPEEFKMSNDWINVDFNEFITYVKNMDLSEVFNIKDVRIDVVEEDGEIAKQIATFVGEFNFDMMVFQANATVTFEIELDYFGNRR